MASFELLEQFVFDRMCETKLPAVTIAAVQNDQVVWASGFGLRNLEQGLPATPHTLFSIGSVTKSFTALAIMQLAEAGKLTLDDPVSTHIDFPFTPLGEPVRIWHLLTHTSGIPALAYAEAVIRATIGAGDHWLPVATASEVLSFMKDAQGWAVAKPGERWCYLNEGYRLAGAIIEKCSGLGYQEYIQKHILQPLGMTRTFFAKEEVEKDRDVAIPYILATDGRRIPTTYPYGSITSDGGLISNVLDLAKAAIMYLGEGRYHGHQLASAESLRDMFSPRITTPLCGGPFGDRGYALGLEVIPQFLGHRLIGHSGSVFVATAYLGFIPEKKVGVALLANGSGYLLSKIGVYALAILKGEEPRKLPFVQREAVLSQLQGTYETYRGTMKALVRRNGDFLSLEIADRFVTTVVPLVPRVVDETRSEFFTLRDASELPVEFSIHGCQVDLLYERYRLRKVGGLP